jgi:hypothetical protein
MRHFNAIPHAMGCSMTMIRIFLRLVRVLANALRKRGLTARISTYKIIDEFEKQITPKSSQISPIIGRFTALRRVLA